MGQFDSLFSPLELGHVSIRNRIVQTAHGKGYNKTNFISQREIDYKVARARGGAGLLITGSRAVHPTAGSIGRNRAYDRDGIGADRRLVEEVHRHGAKIFGQLAHAGAMASSDANDDYRVLWSSSPVAASNGKEIAKEMEHEDIEELIEYYRRSAQILRAATFDGLELHFAHNYLIHQFISPLFNSRTDRYGGSLEARLRLPMEILSAVRDAVGDDFVVGVRMGMSDYTEGGHSLADAKAFARLLTDSGHVSYLNLSVGGSNKAWEISPSDIAEGHLLDDAASIKGAVPEMPTLAIGGIQDPGMANGMIEAGKADLIGFNRTLIADPEYPNKVRDGRLDEVTHCIRANQGCVSRRQRGLPLACTVNPVAGREGRFGELTPAAVRGRWLVIGGGPAGMKASQILAQRGHRVTLLERERELGGQVRLLSQTPGRDSVSSLTVDLVADLDRLGVEVRLGTTVQIEDGGLSNFDGIIVATGAVPSRTGYSTAIPAVSQLPGADLPLVVTPWEVLSNPIGGRGDRVVVLDDDGTRYAAGTTETLLDRGVDVLHVARHHQLFPATTTTLDRGMLMKRVMKKGIKYRVHSWALEINDGAVRILDLLTGATEEASDIDAVVLIGSREADDGLYHGLKKRGLPVRRIGDCVAPRTLDHAVYEGFVAGQELWDRRESIIAVNTLETWR